ncbi:MAG: redoxin domain-containing protein [Proteobacteria bacterium]|nr:redoxin domain-containing protein [Desulfobacula sp.]MBU3951324.1 redoxin domain-containing protein [Pseudomonadota bacterium]MBU4130363.1 redoxin domain-containing protein [Pseudomonadota bacterium]
MKKDIFVGMFILFLALPAVSMAASAAYGEKIYDPGLLAPVDSKLAIGLGQKAPDFTLPAVSGKSITLSQFRGKKNVLISFIPAAWTPVCSDQWPGYNIAKPLFESHDTLLLGVSVDNIPTLFAWTREMGDLWFEVLSDFWPHGQTASTYGVLRSNGTAERALILVDKQGIIRFIHVSDINVRPDLGMIMDALKKISQ